MTTKELAFAQSPVDVWVLCPVCSARGGEHGLAFHSAQRSDSLRSKEACCFSSVGLHKLGWVSGQLHVTFLGQREGQTDGQRDGRGETNWRKPTAVNVLEPR